VRFVYVHRAEHYLSIEDKRDVIEQPITGDLDVSGWDLRKALKLLRKSNPPLLEWLMSPIVYRERPELSAGLRALAPRYYSPRATFFHYLHMAKGNSREYLQGEIVWRKKYFYVLRPLLAMRWIERGLGMPPIEFDALLARTVPENPLREAIEALLVEKRAGTELGDGPRIAEISDFVATELARFERIAGEQLPNDAPTAALDECFRATLAAAWAS
jgi:predicted nucleotidyltransferase